MNPAISQFPCGYFYEGKLVDDPCVKVRRGGFAGGGSACADAVEMPLRYTYFGLLSLFFFSSSSRLLLLIFFSFFAIFFAAVFFFFSRLLS